MANKSGKNTSGQLVSGQPEEVEQATNSPEEEELMKLDDDLTSGDGPFPPEEDDQYTKEKGDDVFVVSKGHTLYHNGEKYQQFHRLTMDDVDAAPLLKNGVIVAYSDLLKQVSRHGD